MVGCVAKGIRSVWKTLDLGFRHVKKDIEHLKEKCGGKGGISQVEGSGCNEKSFQKWAGPLSFAIHTNQDRDVSICSSTRCTYISRWYLSSKKSDFFNRKIKCPSGDSSTMSIFSYLPIFLPTVEKLVKVFSLLPVYFPRIHLIWFEKWCADLGIFK